MLSVLTEMPVNLNEVNVFPHYDGDFAPRNFNTNRPNTAFSHILFIFVNAISYFDSETHLLG